MIKNTPQTMCSMCLCVSKKSEFNDVSMPLCLKKQSKLASNLIYVFQNDFYVTPKSS